MGSPIAELFVKITGDSKGLDNAIDGLSDKFGSFGGIVKGALQLITGPGGVIAGFALLAKYIGQSGVAFNDFSDLFNSKTGKIGDDLRELNDAFKQALIEGLVFGSEDASKAFALLASRMQLSGAKLTDTLILFNDFADALNEDINKVTPITIDLFKSWGVELDQMPAAMDALYRATTLSGKGLDEIANSMTQNGAILRSLGMSFNSATGFVAAFASAGIDSSRLMMGINTAIAKFAKEGKEAGPAISAVFDSIKNAKDGVTATAIAVETFGNRAGNQLADAIRSGAVDIDKFTKATNDSAGAMNNAAQAGSSFRENMQKLKNIAQVSAGAQGEVWVELANILVEILLPAIQSLSSWYVESFGKILTNTKETWAKIKPFFTDLGRIASALIDFWRGLFTGDLKLVWNALLRTVLSVIDLVLQGIMKLGKGVEKGFNGIIHGINKAAAFLKLPIKPIEDITFGVENWDNWTQNIIASLDKEAKELKRVNTGMEDFKDSEDAAGNSTEDTEGAIVGATEALDTYNLSIAMGVENSRQYSIELQKLFDDIVPLTEATHDYSAYLQDLLNNVTTVDQDTSKLKKDQAELTKTYIGAAKAVQQLLGPLIELATTLGLDSDAMQTFGGIASDAIDGVTAALSGNWIGVATAALGIINKVVKWFNKGKEAAREAARTTESYMETIKTGEGKLLKWIEMMTKLRSMHGIQVVSVEIDYSKLTLFKELAASYGDAIGQTLGDAITNGMSKADFMAEIGAILIEAMIAAALATGPIASAMAAIGEKIAYMVINGFTDEGMSEVEAMAASLYDTFSNGVLPIVQRIRDMFGTSGASEEVGSFASGVTNWHGGVADVGEQGRERVYLPPGSSVEPNGQGSSRGGVVMNFNSPRTLSPLETKLQMIAASRQLAFETGGNF